jgi:hypothetical protein
VTIGGPEVDRGVIAVLGMLVAVALFLLLRRSPKLAIVTAIATLSLVPIWIGVNLGFNGNLYLPLGAVVVGVAAVAMLPVSDYRLSGVDLVVLFLGVLVFFSLFAGNLSVALAFVLTTLTYFVSGFLLGRFAPSRVGLDWIYGAVAVIFTIVAVLAIIEFLTGWNPFVTLKSSSTLFTQWSVLQERGGVLRAEGAFGHSIALGSSLAMAIPLTIGSRFHPGIRFVMVLLMLTATVFTFSRTSIVGAGIGVILCVLFLPGLASVRTRVALTTAAVTATVALMPVVLTVFDDAGTEASGSAAYRVDLVSLIGRMNIIGTSNAVRRAPTGELYFDNFQSIDSQLILTGITSGFIAVIVVVLALVGAVLLVLSGRAQPTTIALVAQIPALAAVALITQYATVLWFVVGLMSAGFAMTSGRTSTTGAADREQQRLERSLGSHHLTTNHTRERELSR